MGQERRFGRFGRCRLSIQKRPQYRPAVGPRLTRWRNPDYSERLERLEAIVPQNKNGAVCLVVPARLSRKSHLTYVVCTLSAAGGDDEDQRFHSWLEHRCDGACIIVGASQDASGHSNVADADAGDSAPAYSDGAHADAPSGSSAAADWLPDPS